MFRSLVLAAAVVAAFPSFSNAAVSQEAAPKTPSAQTITVLRMNDRDGSKRVFEITAARADELPRWEHKVASDPPLAAGEALRIAAKWMNERRPQDAPFELVILNLARFYPSPGAGVCGVSVCWYYQIGFAPQAIRPMQIRTDFYAVVLFDGSIVEPRVEPPSAPTGAQGAPASAPSQGNQPDATPDTAVRPGNGVTYPSILHEVRAQYTSAAMKAKIQGSVILEAVVKPDGTVDHVRVVRSLDAVYGLDEAAVAAAKQWRFKPGTRQGVPVPVLVSMELTFTLGK